jgi:hypothetical protein
MGARGKQRYSFLRKALLLMSIISFSSLFLLYSAVHIITKRYEHSAVNDIVVGIPSALYTSVFASNGSNVSLNENTTSLIEFGANYSSPRVSCDVQLKESNILSWKKGVVTQFQPIIPCNCTKLVNLNEKEISRVNQSLDKWHKNHDFLSQLEYWSHNGSNCNEITAEFLNSFYESQEERDFPLAFSIVMYGRTAQIVRLFKAIYRPHNVYCFHPDGKSDAEYVSKFRHLSKCLDNVIMPQDLINVYWGHHSIMDAQMACLAELAHSDVRNKYKWKYAINLCGTELPLRTNREMVRALEPLYQQGLSAIDQRVMGDSFKTRFHHKCVLNNKTGLMLATSVKMDPPPYRIEIHKSYNFIAAKDSFVDFLLHSHVAQEFRKWLMDVLIPEEHFYASLYYHNHTYPILNLRTYPSVTVYQWMTTVKTEEANRYCRGKTVHYMCIVTSADLARIYKLALAKGRRTYFFFNKYHMDRDHVVMDCMEQRLVRQNQREFLEDCRAS